MLETPVVFCVFNRADLAKRVFAAIREARPKRLFVVADGPRADRPEEAERCEEARAAATAVDWPCDVQTNFADTNMGSGHRVSSGISWALEQVEHAIILEDDCLPDPSFFPFCEELLERYADDTRVAQVSGDNFQQGRPPCPHSYYFSRYTHIWGWATWRRAWKLFDFKIRDWPRLRDSGWLESELADDGGVQYWREAFDTVYEGRPDIWDFQWFFTCWCQRMVSILPAVNLVSNLGYRADATHTIRENPAAQPPVTPMSFPLSHPDLLALDHAAERHTAKKLFYAGAMGRLVQFACSFREHDRG